MDLKIAISELALQRIEINLAILGLERSARLGTHTARAEARALIRRIRGSHRRIISELRSMVSRPSPELRYIEEATIALERLDWLVRGRQVEWPEDATTVVDRPNGGDDAIDPVQSNEGDGNCQ